MRAIETRWSKAAWRAVPTQSRCARTIGILHDHGLARDRTDCEKDRQPGVGHEGHVGCVEAEAAHIRDGEPSEWITRRAKQRGVDVERVGEKGEQAQCAAHQGLGHLAHLVAGADHAGIAALTHLGHRCIQLAREVDHVATVDVAQSDAREVRLSRFFVHQRHVHEDVDVVSEIQPPPANDGIGIGDFAQHHGHCPRNRRGDGDALPAVCSQCSEVVEHGIGGQLQGAVYRGVVGSRPGAERDAAMHGEP